MRRNLAEISSTNNTDTSSSFISSNHGGNNIGNGNQTGIYNIGFDYDWFGDILRHVHPRRVETKGRGRDLSPKGQFQFDFVFVDNRRRNNSPFNGNRFILHGDIHKGRASGRHHAALRDEFSSTLCHDHQIIVT